MGGVSVLVTIAARRLALARCNAVPRDLLVAQVADLAEAVSGLAIGVERVSLVLRDFGLARFGESF